MKTFLLVMSMLPGIISAVKQAEDFIPLPGQGKAKLDFTLGVISDTVDAAAEVLPAVTKVVARVVELANATGSFKKGEK